jgi:hypothetical protein
MYVPPLDSLLRAIGLDRATYNNSETIGLPKEMFRLLVQLALSNSDFNEAGYLRANPDVADAVRRGEVEDARLHYIGFGYFEGRIGGTPAVDERWYLKMYSDVAQGIRAGKIGSASEHYDVIGASEGRSPSATYLPIAEHWKKALVAE